MSSLVVQKEVLLDHFSTPFSDPSELAFAELAIRKENAVAETEKLSDEVNMQRQLIVRVARQQIADLRADNSSLTSQMVEKEIVHEAKEHALIEQIEALKKENAATKALAESYKVKCDAYDSLVTELYRGTDLSRAAEHCICARSKDPQTVRQIDWMQAHMFKPFVIAYMEARGFLPFNN